VPLGDDFHGAVDGVATASLQIQHASSLRATWGRTGLLS
jgi:hypothetical protein